MLQNVVVEDTPALGERADSVGKRCRCFRACVRKRPVDGAARRAFVFVDRALEDIVSRFEHGGCVGMG